MTHISEETIAWIAGDIVAAMAALLSVRPEPSTTDQKVATWAVQIARLVADEVERTASKEVSV